MKILLCHYVKDHYVKGEQLNKSKPFKFPTKINCPVIDVYLENTPHQKPKFKSRNQNH